MSQDLPSTAALPESLALRLRQETADSHRALEDALDLLRPDMTRESYVATLMAFYGFLLPWEAEINRSLSPRLEARVRQRRHVWRIVQDITALTGYPPEKLGSDYCSGLPEIGSDSAALGSMYVIEGSTLGGRVISAHMREKLALTPENGCAYFSGYGEQNGRMWTAFRSLLDECVPAGEHDQAVKAASGTFDCLRKWLIEKGVAKGTS